PSLEREVQTQGLADRARAWISTNFPILGGEEPIVLADAASAGGFEEIERGPAKWLKQHVTSGQILISASRNDGPAVMLRSGLSVSRFITEGNKPFFNEELQEPGRRASW